MRRNREDIVPLVHHFSEQFFQRTGRARPVWRSDALGLLQDHAWPGNVRELANAVERATIFCRGTDVQPDDFPGEVRTASKDGNSASAGTHSARTAA